MTTNIKTYLVRLQERIRTGSLCKSVTPTEARSLNKIIEPQIEPVMCLATAAYVYAACTVRVTVLVLISDYFQILRSYMLLL